jgi:hypothetical protein
LVRRFHLTPPTSRSNYWKSPLIVLSSIYTQGPMYTLTLMHTCIYTLCWLLSISQNSFTWLMEGSGVSPVGLSSFISCNSPSYKDRLSVGFLQ